MICSSLNRPFIENLLLLRVIFSRQLDYLTGAMSGSASFYRCSFFDLSRPVSIRDASAQFSNCTWSDNQPVALAALGKAKVEVLGSAFSRSAIAVVAGDSAQTHVAKSTLENLYATALSAFDAAKVVLEECKISDINRCAIELDQSSSLSLSSCTFSNTRMA
ncbi:MAG: right-handed parallel beta-helix repeat-containing protein, partial [Cytophagaceae bacterium]